MKHEIPSAMEGVVLWTMRRKKLLLAFLVILTVILICVFGKSLYRNDIALVPTSEQLNSFEKQSLQDRVHTLEDSVSGLYSKFSLLEKLTRRHFADLEQTHKEHVADVVSIPKFNHLCHSSVSLEKPVGSNVVVIGASSFLGSRIAVGFKDAGYRVTALEDTINLLIQPLAWYRWDQLSKKGLPPKYLDFNDSSELRSALKDHKSSTIFYIPSPVFDGLENQRTFKTSHISHTLQNFVKLLEIVRTDYLHDFRVVLLTLPNHAALSIQKAWLRTFEFSLSSFQYLYGLNIAVLKVDGVYGPWQDQNMSLNVMSLHTKHWYIDDIEKLLMTVSNDNKVCQEIDLGTGLETSSAPMNLTAFSDGILKTSME